MGAERPTNLASFVKRDDNASVRRAVRSFVCIVVALIKLILRRKGCDANFRARFSGLPIPSTVSKQVVE